MSEYFASRPSSPCRVSPSDDEEPDKSFEAYFRRREDGQRVGNAARRRNHHPTSDDEDEDNSFAACLRRRDARQGAVDTVPGRGHHPSNGHLHDHTDWDSDGRSSSPYERQITHPFEEYSRSRSGRSFLDDREEHLLDEHPHGHQSRRQVAAGDDDEDYNEQYEVFGGRWDECREQRLRRQQLRHSSPQAREVHLRRHHTPDYGTRERRFSESVGESARTRAIDEERREVMRRIFGDDYGKKFGDDEPEESTTSYEGPGW